MSTRIATWNINSVRLRIGLVTQFLEDHAPDILCLQETKCPNDQFPEKALHAAGYEHIEFHGQKGYHGVATISKRPLSNSRRQDFVAMGDARHLATDFETELGTARIHNFYVPAGGDEPDPSINPKFDHKLKFLNEMKAISATQDDIPAILVGDLNIAPREEDVWSHKQLLKVVSHTPQEVELLDSVRDTGGWEDAVRNHSGPDEIIFSWWSYRSKDWTANNRGRRLDHVWNAPELMEKVRNVTVLREARSWVKPSDHVPIIVDYDF
jgi:exodeoxyribonuclease-3